MKILKPHVMLACILLMGFGLRLYGINWDGACCLHPDERAIVMYTLPLAWPQSLQEFLSPQSSLNPHFFAYGNLPLYLLKIVSTFVGLFDPIYTTYTHINLVGRSLAILFDLGTLVMLFLLGKRIVNTSLGLLAAGLYAISWFPIQNAHYYTVDIPLTFFVTTTLYLLVRFYQTPSRRLAVAIGITTGLALVTKMSAVVLVSAFAAAISLDFILVFLKQPHRPHIYLSHFPIFFKRLLTEGILMLLAMGIVFCALQPYALIDNTAFVQQNLQQAHMTRDAYTFPYTLQYVDKIPYLYELKNIFLFGLGPLLATTAFAGVFFVLTQAFKKINNNQASEELILLVFFIVYFLIVGDFAIGFMRYMLPVYPLLILFAAFFLIRVFHPLSSRSNLLLFSCFFFLVSTWTLSFMHIYSKPNTRVQATTWINQHISSGSTLAVEHWDDQLPLQGGDRYQFVTLPLYNQPDDHLKWQSIDASLAYTDYIILASNRLYVPLQKLSDCTKYRQCYPQTAAYYHKLFSGQLGFVKVAEFSEYPTVPLINLKIDDGGADESFTVYDHPKIMIFKKTF